MLADESYIIERLGRGGGVGYRERKEEGGRAQGEVFPLHACSCPSQLEYFSQHFLKRDSRLFSFKMEKK